MLLLALAAVVLLGSAPAAFAQDQGDPDTLVWVASRPEAGADDSTFMMELYYWGDQQQIVGTAFGYHWDNANVTLDSAVLSAEANTGFDLVKILYFGNNLATTNDSQFVMCILSRIFANGITPAGSRVRLANYYFSLSSWTGADQVVFDTALGGAGGATQIVNDFDGNEFTPYMFPTFTIQDPSDAGDLLDPTVPENFALTQNYPNPFNPTTTIQFSLPVQSKVQLDVYNLLGQKVRTLRNEEMDAGTYSVEWNGTNDGGAKVASGVYFYKLETSQFVDTKKMMLLK
jgi:hypothetical protein